MATLLILSSLLSVSVGPVNISLIDSLSAVFNWATEQNIGNLAPHEQLVVSNVRLPRTLLALAVGAMLAQCGAVMQGLFRNPLADPGIIGVSSGAALGAAICIVQFPHAESVMISVSAFSSGLITTLIVYRLASSALGTSVVLLLLSGVTGRQDMHRGFGRGDCYVATLVDAHGFAGLSLANYRDKRLLSA